jgi:HEAT repeat protein
VYARVARDDDYTVRAAALRALNRCRAQGYTDLYLKNLDDSEPLVRLQAADALGNIPDPSTIDDLVDHMRNDISPDVRIACTDALRNFPQGEVISALVEMLDDRNFAVAWQARQSLALISGQDYRYDKQAWLDYFARAGMPG